MSKMPICMLHYTQLFVCLNLWWAIFELCPFCVKSASNDPKWHWHVRGQKYQYMYACYIHPWVPNFHRFRSTISLFWDMPLFWETALNDPKWPCHVQGQKYQYACYIILYWGPNFHLFCATMSHFWVTPNFLGEVHQITPNDFDNYLGQSLLIHVSIDHSIFISIWPINMSLFSGFCYKKLIQLLINQQLIVWIWHQIW